MRLYGKTGGYVLGVAVLSCLVMLTACPEPENGGGDPTNREEGQSDFVSAGGEESYGDGEWGRDDGETGAPEADDPAGGDGEERTVEEGDIYRVLSGSLILNLNSYRGLQVIDFSDPTQPEIIGRASVSGYPVELYVHGDYAFVLMNDWRGYYGSRFAQDVQTVQGGLVLAVDLSDPTNPMVLQHVHVPGSIQTSRLVHGGGQAALYVAAGEYSHFVDEQGQWHDQLQTYVRSFEVTGGEIVQRSDIDLGGFVSDIQATPEALLVARNERWWSQGEEPSRVAVIDISSPDGTMVEGDEVEVAGFVFTQFNMDLYEGVLRVVSGSRWGSEPTNYVQTFDASDFSDIQPIDQAEFGDGEDLYATLFLGNKAFFVTYRQVDPFHAFEITDEGLATEMSEFVVSGWNDYFRPVFAESRLIGIGKNDQEGNRQAVSLYDITDLSNPSPMLARAEVEMYWSWSEAQWDHRAFSVLEGAVDVLSDDGVQETGLVLLPFSGYEYDETTGYGSYLSAVQIFTFSDQTLTRRGVMEHPSRVRRSFLASSDAVANLSETDLAFFDHTNPDQPQPLGSVELAPDYSDYFLFGQHAVRRKDVGYNYWWYESSDQATTHLEVIDADEDPDLAEPLASFEVERDSRLFQVGDLLVALWNRREEVNQETSFVPTLAVYDLSDPLSPQEVATMDVRQQLSSSSYWTNWEAHVAGEGIVFVEREYHNEIVGTDEVCYLDEAVQCSSDSEEGRDCVWLNGRVDCERDEQGELVCTGMVDRCETDATGDWSCEPVDASTIDDMEQYVYCYERDEYRYWNEVSLRPIDLSNPASPEVRSPIRLQQGDNGAGVFAKGSDLYVSFNRPENVEEDDRNFVRWFFKKIDLSSYSSPEIGSEINVPGMLIAAEGDLVY
ncbi:MAG: beta-propeller domain-containing protein, partial [Myxococcota bacterium]